MTDCFIKDCSNPYSAITAIYGADGPNPRIIMGNPTPRTRGRKGVATRRRRLARTNGMCEMCMPEPRIATKVDHIIPLTHGGTDTDDNTRNLCDEHHRQVTAEQFGHEYKPRVEFDSEGRVVW